MERIIQLDSTYTNKTLYPYDTQFVIEVNGTPPQSTNDVRSTYYTNNFIYYRYLWIGNQTLTQFAGVENNAVNITFYALSGSEVVLNFSYTGPPSSFSTINANIYNQYIEYIKDRSDYFVGCLFVFDISGGNAASFIKSYDGNTMTAYLNNCINFTANHYSCTTNNGYIVNPSYQFPNSILVLGSTRITMNNNTLTKGLNTNLVIQNARTQELSTITNFTFLFRNVILTKDIEDYNPNDIYLVRPKGNVISCSLASNRFRYSGIKEYMIVNTGTGFTAGDQITIPATQPAVFLISSVDVYGGITELKLINPGDGFTQTTYGLVSPTFCDAAIYVGAVSPYFVLSELVYFQDTNFLVFFPNFYIWENIVYFLVVGTYLNNIYFDADASMVDNLNNPAFYYNLTDISGASYCEFIPYSTYFPNLNVPLVAYNQPVCYEVRILSISMPNLPVCGFDVLLSHFPYVLVTFTNFTSGSGENTGLIISNNQNAAPATFVCPIANIQNPDLVRYVVVNSYQRMVFKFSPTDSIRFKITLPNGELLRFKSTECTRSNYYAINSSNDLLFINDIKYTLTHGGFNPLFIATMIEELTASSVQLTVTYDSLINAFTFVSTTSSFTFNRTSSCFNILGFDTENDHTSTLSGANNVLTSTVQSTIAPACSCDQAVPLNLIYNGGVNERRVYPIYAKQLVAVNLGFRMLG
jgi:hypothetical protein